MATKRISNSINSQKKYFTICLGFIFILILLLNIITPLVADDYSYSFSYVDRNLRINSFSDVFQSIRQHYYTMNGRSIAHFIVHTFLWWGKPIFNVVNALVYTWLGVVLYLHVNYTKKINISLYMLINFCIWCFVPVFGQTTLWLDGACNYMWGTTIILSFLLVYKIHSGNDINFSSNVWIVIMFILGFIAGGYNENVSAACILTIILFIIYYKLNNIKITGWCISGLIANIIGWIFMITAPSNLVRASKYAIESSKIMQYFTNFKLCTRYLVEYGGLLISVFCVLLILNIRFKKNKYDVLISCIYFITAMAANYAMIIPPAYPPRAMFGTILFIILACAQLCRDIDLLNLKSITISLGIFSCLNYLYAFNDLWKVNCLFKERTSYIEEQKMLSNLDIVTYSISANTKYSALYGISDLSSNNKNYWVNANMARYYSVNSIIANKAITQK